MRYGRRLGLQFADAEDIRQIVMVRLSRALPEFMYSRQRESSARSWVESCEIKCFGFGRPNLASTRVDSDDGESPARFDDVEADRQWERVWTDHHLRLAMRRLRRKHVPIDGRDSDICVAADHAVHLVYSPLDTWPEATLARSSVANWLADDHLVLSVMWISAYRSPSFGRLGRSAGHVKTAPTSVEQPQYFIWRFAMFQQKGVGFAALFCVVLLAPLSVGTGAAPPPLMNFPPHPIVAGAGCRYMEITPQPWAADVAIAIHGISGCDGLFDFDPNVTCYFGWVQADGTVGSNPVYQSVAAWGTVYVHDAGIVPGAFYAANVHALNGGTSIANAACTTEWGDVDENGVVNILDVQRVVQGFQGLLTDPHDFHAADVTGTAGCDDVEGVINVMDFVAVLDAFQGAEYPCDDPCP